MKKFLFALGLMLAFVGNVWAEEAIDRQIKIKIDEVLTSCGPKINDEYVPDLILKQQYSDGAACLEKQIKKLAKDIFDEDGYKSFCASLTQASSSYLQMTRLLNEKSKGMDGLPGTFEQMQTYSQLYNFLYQLFEIVINYNIQQQM